MAAESRKVELSKIHIAKKQLCMTDDAYRAMLKMVAGVESSAALSAVGRSNVLAHMKTLGAEFRKGNKKRTRPAADKVALTSKIKALLADGKYPDTYGDSMVQHMFGVQRWEWLTPEQMSKLVAALAIHKKRREKQVVCDETM
jgi:phage gp16-like protein